MNKTKQADWAMSEPSLAGPVDRPASDRGAAMLYARAFAAGFLSTLIFHQSVLGLLFLTGVTSRAPFNFALTAPLGVPAVLSLAFWGGIWGVALWPLLRKCRGPAFWAGSVLLGAIGPTLVALFVVLPLHGLPPAGGWDPHLIVTALLVNAAWGLGYGLLMRWLQPGQARGLQRTKATGL